MKNKLVEEKLNINYIYMVRTRESVRMNENVYKIGKSKQESLSRICGYPKGSELIIQVECVDCDFLETHIFKKLKNFAKQRTDMGNEYFEGNKFKIKNLIWTTVYDQDIKYNQNLSDDEVPVKIKKSQTVLVKNNANVMNDDKLINKPKKKDDYLDECNMNDLQQMMIFLDIEKKRIDCDIKKVIAHIKKCCTFAEIKKCRELCLYINNGGSYPSNSIIKIYDLLYDLTNENIQSVCLKLMKKYKLKIKFFIHGPMNKNKLIGEVIRTKCTVVQVKDIIKLVSEDK